MIERKLKGVPWFGAGWIVIQSDCISEGVYKVVLERNGYQMELIFDSNKNIYITDKRCKRCEQEYGKSSYWEKEIPIPGPYCSKECANFAKDINSTLKPFPTPKRKGLDLWVK